MEFEQFKVALQNHFKEITQNVSYLFEVDVDKDELWNVYLDSYPEGTNELYKKRREYDCSCCRQFIKSIGATVVIENGHVKTIWDFNANDSTFQQVCDTLSAFVKSKIVSDVYFTNIAKIGTNQNFALTDGVSKKWEHFYLELPNKFVDRSGKSAGDYKGTFRDTKNVFKRSLDEITEDSILVVLELIAQNSLYKGEEWKSVLEQFLKYKQDYSKIASDLDKNNYTWEMSVKVGAVIGRIKNHSIGTLLMNISENMDLDEAVKKYEAIVAPTNYKRPKAIFTKKMLEDAKKTIEDLGYLESLDRRFAKLDDITVNNILFSNKDASKKIAGASVFDELSSDLPVNPKKFDKVEEISIEDFVEKVLPTTNNLEVLLENRHATNMVSLVAPENKDSKTMFKWNNGFSWAYSGNITDSNVRENVKNAGGKVDGVLRFSIQWNDEDYNPNDFDAHCIEPNGNEIYYGNKHDYSTDGNLDVDIITPKKDIAAVENITWPTKAKMKNGVYKFFVHNYSNNGGRSGFKAEIEFDGQIYSFNYDKELRHKETVSVATITLGENGFTIKENLSSNVSSREVWGEKTNQFIPTSVVMYSPNYWDKQDGIGNKHYFFMLKNCINPEQPNGFYNEFVKQELVQHKRVFEALGSKMAVKYTEDQLSGLGFSSTKRNELVVRATGSVQRILKIKF